LSDSIPEPPKDVQYSGDVVNAGKDQMDVEFQKHILNVNVMQLAFYKAFSGWRAVDETEEKTLFGRTKLTTKTKYKVDYYVRFMNEAGANFCFNTVYPLISPASSTSHAKPIDIYNLWNGHLFTIEITLLDSYYISTYICNELVQSRDKDDTDLQYCNEISSNANTFRKHQELFGHKAYEKSKNPFQLNIERYPNIIGTLATMALLTMKAKEGFTMKELAESFVTTNMQKQMYMNNVAMSSPYQQHGLISRLIPRQ
jgi:hypothetical protein